MFNRWLEKPRRSALLLGPRRAGKSTFLKKNYKDFKYLTLDDLDLLDLAQRDPKALFEGEKKLIIDEIQRVPKLTIAAKFAMDQNKAFVLMSGSSRIGLLDASADSLAGRIDLIELPPSCWGEAEGKPSHSIFEDQVPLLQLKEAQRKLESFMRYGGFPEVVMAGEKEEKEAILKNYKNTYFTRDLSLLSNIENLQALLSVLHHYARSLGSITQVVNFQQEAGLSYLSAKKYLNSLYQSGLGFTLSGYQYGPAKRYIKGSKSYYCDAGMITALQSQCSRGQIVENFVISEIEKRRKLGFYQADQLFFYQSTSGAEIDLIIPEKDGLKAIEVKAKTKLSSKDTRSLREFVEQDPKKRKAYLFYMGQEYQDIGPVLAVPIAAIYRGK